MVIIISTRNKIGVDIIMGQLNNVQKPQQLIRGGIYIVNLPNNGGSIQHSTRPCVLISNNTCNRFSPVLHVCPISSQTLSKSKLPTHIPMSKNNCGLIRDSIALCEQTMLVNKDVINMDQVGFCDEETLLRISRGVAIQFGLVDLRNNVAYAN